MSVINISPRSVTIVLSAVVAGLVMASMAGQISTYYLGYGSVFGLVNLFSLDREANLPSWYSAMTLLGSAGLLGIIAAVHHQRGSRWRRYWAGLSLVFVYLSADEAASIHELSIGPVRALLGTGGILHWAWVVPGIILVGLLGLIYLRFVIGLPARTRRLVMVAGALFIGGALGVEMLGSGWFVEHGRRNMGYVLFWTVEETLEMMGIIVFIHALLGYLRDETGQLRVAFGDREPGGREAPKGSGSGAVGARR